MRREHLYLQDILDACDMLQTFLEEMDSATFLARELHQASSFACPVIEYPDTR